MVGMLRIGIRLRQRIMRLRIVGTVRISGIQMAERIPIASTHGDSRAKV